MDLLGITPALWDQMRAPRAGAGGELDLHTQTYIDCFIALDCLHMPYSEYIRRTSHTERELLQLYLGLKTLKEEHSREVAEARAALKRETQRGVRDGARM